MVVRDLAVHLLAAHPVVTAVAAHPVVTAVAAHPVVVVHPVVVHPVVGNDSQTGDGSAWKTGNGEDSFLALIL